MVLTIIVEYFKLSAEKGGKKEGIKN